MATAGLSFEIDRLTSLFVLFAVKFVSSPFLFSCCSKGTMGRKRSQDKGSLAIRSRAKLEYPLS